MGDPDCSASLIGISPAAKHFKTKQRHRIANVLANNPWWSADLAKEMTETGIFCEDDGSNWLSKRYKMQNVTEAELKASWELWEAPAIPWRPLSEWRLLEYLWSVGSWMLCHRSLARHIIPIHPCCKSTAHRYAVCIHVTDPLALTLILILTRTHTLTRTLLLSMGWAIVDSMPPYQERKEVISLTPTLTTTFFLPQVWTNAQSELRSCGAVYNVD